MANPAEGATAVELAGVGDPLQSERPLVRRRLVQSTLFPRSQDNATEKEDEDRDQKDDGDEEEYCMSQGKKKSKRKPRASKTVAVSTKKSPGNKLDDKVSPVIAKSNFFVKASAGGRLQKEQHCIGSIEKDEKTCSPVESTVNDDSFYCDAHLEDMRTPRHRKQRVNSTPQKRARTTPRKNIANGDLKETSPEQISENRIQIGNAAQLIPDLRLEAKMMAEENARMFGGRQIHPFFSSCKVAKKNQETIDLEINLCSAERKDKNCILSPIHVFEKVQEDAGSPDWGKWIISKRSFITTGCDVTSVCSPVFDGSVRSLHFDDFLSFYPSGMSVLQNEANHHEDISLDQCPSLQEYRPAVSPILSADEPAMQCEFLKNVNMSLQSRQKHEMVKADFSSRHAGCINISDFEWEDKLLPERMMTCYQTCGNHPENSLWTNKYLPGKAIEVCGNGESVNALSEWLRVWHDRGFLSSKDLTTGREFIMEDDDYNCYRSDCDSESRGEENGLKNVLLITGPVGSGKSAAVYACAKEQGFHVIEVNASDTRTRTRVMQRFKDGVESYWVERPPETPVGSESKRMPDSLPVMSDTMKVQGFDREIIELIPLSDEEYSQIACKTPEKSVGKDNKVANSIGRCKPLILFEDVDAIPSEDHGLVATIQKLAETAKRPIILTSNSPNPSLPSNLDRFELRFTKPSLKELLCHVSMVCAAEKAKVQPSLVERFIECCQGDIRKTIMHLQFWCQGQRNKKDSKEQRTYGPVLLDLDAGHRILPKMIPWGCPSQLSEIVEMEIAKSLFMMEESLKLVNVVNEGEANKNKRQKKRLKRHKSDPDSIEAKKEAILRLHSPVQDGIELATQLDTPCGFSDTSGSPVAFTRRNVRRKLSTVLSSDSGDEELGDKSPAVRFNFLENTNNEMAVDSTSPSYCPETEIYLGSVPEQLLVSKGEKLDERFNPLSEQLLNSKEKLQENCSHCPETAVYTQFDGTHVSVNTSCVPEASFVAETEIIEGTSTLFSAVSCGHVADAVEALSTSSGLIQTVPLVGTNNHDQYISGLSKNLEMVENFDIYTESAHGEAVGDSHTESFEAVSRGYQVMDECSRMDFCRNAESKDKPRSWVLMDSVQETWRKIRSRTDLKQYVTPEQRDSSLILKLAHGMSNLLSEADMLLVDCQPLTYDFLESSTVSSEKSHSFSWYDDQLYMTSTIAQHGICFYAKEIAAVASKNSSDGMDLALEMLASSTNTMALGKLASQENRISNSEMGPLKSVISMKSGLDSRLCSAVRSVVPSRSYLATKGNAFYEYLSSLCQISRSEGSRLSEGIDGTKHRRVRIARNYLSAGALSPNDISLLGQYNCYRKYSSQSMDASPK